MCINNWLKPLSVCKTYIDDVFRFFYFSIIVLSTHIFFVSAEIITPEQLAEGKRQLSRHKKNTERSYRRSDLRSFLSNAGKKDGEGGFLSRILGGKKKGA